MENRKFVVLALGIIFVISAPSVVFAYEPTATHKGLTRDLIRYYERFYPNTFTDNEKQAIEKGAVEEDAPEIRAAHHFYDPIYNNGLEGVFSSSKEWAQDTSAQAEWSASYLAALGNVTRPYFSSQTDYSWDRAIYEYAHGDKARGLESLGHILHLLEDATVPDHTRNDPHVPYLNELTNQQSPYEHFTSQFNLGNIKVSESLISEGKIPVLLSSLNEYFDKLAGYSNSNFFSKDTILEKKYNFPIIQNEVKNKLDRKFGYYNGHLLVWFVSEKRNLSTGEIDTEYSLTDPEHLILTDYWNLLSREAVQNGAGVIKLFFDEVEKEKKTLALEQKNKSWLSRKTEQVASAFSSIMNSVGLSGSSSGAAAVLATNDLQPTTNSNTSNMDGQGEQTTNPVSSNILEQTQLVEPQAPQASAANVSVQQNSVLPATTSLSPTDNIPTPRFTFNMSPGFGGGGGPPPKPPLVETTTVNNQTETTTTSSLSVATSTATTTPQTVAVILPDPPAIISPTDFSSPFSTTTITFIGTSSPGFIISNDLTVETATTSNSGNWSIVFTNLLQGTTTVHFVATDGTGATSSPREIIFSVSIPIPPPPVYVGTKTIGYYCKPYTQSYVEAGYYLHTGMECYYLTQNLNGSRYGDVYRGTVGSSTMVNGHLIFGWPTSTPQYNDIPSLAPVQGDNFFTAIYEVHNNDVAYITAFRNYFKTGANPPPYLDYGIINWKYGTTSSP